MRPIVIPETHNSIAAFLTLACNLRCSYCINKKTLQEFIGRHPLGG